MSRALSSPQDIWVPPTTSSCLMAASALALCDSEAKSREATTSAPSEKATTPTRAVSGTACRPSIAPAMAPMSLPSSPIEALTSMTRM